MKMILLKLSLRMSRSITRINYTVQKIIRQHSGFPPVRLVTAATGSRHEVHKESERKQAHPARPSIPTAGTISIWLPLPVASTGTGFTAVLEQYQSALLVQGLPQTSSGEVNHQAPSRVLPAVASTAVVLLVLNSTITTSTSTIGSTSGHRPAS
jgi:hypothetical protein